MVAGQGGRFLSSATENGGQGAAPALIRSSAPAPGLRSDVFRSLRAHGAWRAHDPAGRAGLGVSFAAVDVFLAVVVPRRGVFGAARVGRPPVLGHDGLLSEGLSLSDEREHLRRCQVSMTNRQEAYYTEPSELRHIFKDCLYVALAGLRMALFW